MDKQKNVFTKDIEVPKIVMQKAENAFEQIRTGDSKKMKKTYFWRMKKAVVAAALGCVIVIGGVSVYAATTHFSLLSLFKNESSEVQKNAEQLVDHDVSQGTVSNAEQSKWAKFRVQEAICDNNMIHVSIAATATMPDEYLLVPDYVEDNEEISTLGVSGDEGSLSIKQYADKYKKKILKVNAGLSGCNAVNQTMSNTLQEDGTLIFAISTENSEKTKQLTYQCTTVVTEPNGDGTKLLKDEFDFILQDQSTAEIIKYNVIKGQKVKGTDLVIDRVQFTKSDLNTVCKLKYHYTGNKAKWKNGKTKDYDISFFMLDSKGNVIETQEGSGGTLDGVNVTETDYYKLADLPDEITFVAKDVMEKNLYGTFTVQRVQ